jgi:hypothetical protein
VGHVYPLPQQRTNLEPDHDVYYLPRELRLDAVLVNRGRPPTAVSAGRVISLKTMRFVVATGSENTVAMW